MIVLRVLGRLFIILSIIMLIGGMVIWLLGAEITQPAGKAWFQAHVSSLNFCQVIIQRHLYLPGLWDSVIVPHLLTQPLWEAIIIVFVISLILGALFLRIGGLRQQHAGFG